MTEGRHEAAWIGDATELLWEQHRRISEEVAARPPSEPLSERFDWEIENATPEHPGGTGMRRIRPKSVLAQIPRAQRLAELVCARGDGRPRVVAVVYPRGAPVERCEVETEHNSAPVGSSVLVFCACRAQHYIDGGRLRSALLALPRSRRVAVLDVADLTG